MPSPLLLIMRSGSHGSTTGDDDVEEAVVVEVVDDRAARGPDRVETERRRDVHEPADVLLGLERGWRDEILLRHLSGYWPSVMVGDVEQPAHFEVLGVLARYFSKYSIACVEPGRVLRAAGSAEREDAHLGVVVVRAVLDLAAAKVRDTEQLLEFELRALAFRPELLTIGDPVCGLKMFDGLRHVTFVGVEPAPSE